MLYLTIRFPSSYMGIVAIHAAISVHVCKTKMQKGEANQKQQLSDYIASYIAMHATKTLISS